MSKSIFISTVFEDSHRIESLNTWAMTKRLGDVVITHETEDKRIEGKEAIKAHIKNKIKGAGVVLVLIGKDTHNHDWIEAEVELANSFHVKVVCIRIPNTSSPPPKILAYYSLVNFDPESIKKELN
jgi:hypothetical protein